MKFGEGGKMSFWEPGQTGRRRFFPCSATDIMLNFTSYGGVKSWFLSLWEGPFAIGPFGLLPPPPLSTRPRLRCQ